MPAHPDQLELPFAIDRRTRLLAAGRQLVGILTAGLTFLLRWVLRLVLPVLGAAGALQVFPYHATVEGVPFQVQGSLFSRPGLSADTTLGSWEFPDLSGVPIGVHITPEDVDVLELARAADGDMAGFVERLRTGFVDQLGRIAAWLGTELLLGAALGLVAAAAVNLAVRQLRGQAQRPRELRRRSLQLGAAVLVGAVVAGYGWVSYNPSWVRSSRLTGTLAAAQLFPDQLSQYYSQQTKAFDVLGSVIGIQAALQQQIDLAQTPDTALQIMYISDMHLAANYPLVQEYVRSYGVDLVINTGDEAEFGTTGELTASYLDGLRALTSETPMIWLAGNHDSPDVVRMMRSIPGVTVLGTKTSAGGEVTVTPQQVSAFGLTIAGLPDPRVYGGAGDYGSDTPSVVDALEQRTVRAALTPPSGEGTTTASPTGTAATSSRTAASPSNSSVPASSTATAGATAPSYDIFATHEPVAAAELRAVLPGQIRQTNSGHTHAQNDPADLQADDGSIDLVEGSTGAGGLDNLVRGVNRPPIQFSIESVGSDCQFTRAVRFSIDSTDSATTSSAGGSDSLQSYGDDVTASTLYFRPQQVAEGRSCSTAAGLGEVQPIGP